MNLYCRLLWLLLRIWRLQQRGVLEESRVVFRVMPNDCDINFHMNNGRYLSFMDLGRVHLMKQSGLLSAILREKWMPVLAAPAMPDELRLWAELGSAKKQRASKNIK